MKYMLVLGSLFVLCADIAIPSSALAAFADEKKYVLLAPIPGTYDETSCAGGTMNTYNAGGVTGGNNSSTINCTTDFVTYLKGFFRLVISLSSIIAVLVITFEGFKLAVSTSEGARQTAKERIEQALIGLGLVLGSYLILNTINPQLTKISFVVDKVADYAGTSAFLQDGLSQALTEEQIAEAQRLADREANETFSNLATPILQELATLGDCVNADDESCYIRKTELEEALRAAEATTDVRAATNALGRQIRDHVTPLLRPPTTATEINEARGQLAQMWRIANQRITALRAEGKIAEANAVLVEAQKIQQDTSAAIDHRAAYPDGDNNEYGAGGGI